VIVLDTHVWVRWVVEGESALPPAVTAAIQAEERVAVSAVSCFEVALLCRRGRIELPIGTPQWLELALAPAGVECLDVTCAIAERSVGLPGHHRDPADRIIIATALVHNARLVSLEQTFPQYAELSGRLLP
jgi:PIN domain nuclease of toxin-antitoxin system